MSSTQAQPVDTRRTGLIVAIAVASPFAVVMAMLSLAGRHPEPFTLSLGIASLVSGAGVGWLLGPSAPWRPGRVPWRVLIAASAIAVAIGSYVTGGMWELIRSAIEGEPRLDRWIEILRVTAVGSVFYGTLGLLFYGLPMILFTLPFALAWAWLMGHGAREGAVQPVRKRDWRWRHDRERRDA